MKSILFASLDKNSGKTTVELAIAMASGKKIGYMKPFGDNPIYKEKKVVDHDAMLFKEIFKIEAGLDEMCLGLHHSKILHFYKNIEEELVEKYNKLSEGKELFIIESGEFLWKGKSIGLDAFSIADSLDAKIIFVLSGEHYEVMDELSYIADLKEERIEGIILNKARGDEVDRMEGKAKEYGIDFLGYIPYIEELKAMRVSYIAEKLFAKVVAGEKGIEKDIENVFIAALSAPEIRRHPDFKKRKKLIITGGDRADVITACLEEGTSCIVLTNNIVPSTNILAKANEKEIPLLSVRSDTYTTAKLVENIQPVILSHEKEKLEIIEEAGKRHLDMNKILG